MNILNKIVSAAKGQQIYYTSSSELTPGKVYSCEEFVFVNTKYGYKTLMMLKGNINVILPNNVNNLIVTTDVLKLVNKNIGSVRFIGIHPKTYQAEYEFIYKSDQSQVKMQQHQDQAIIFLPDDY